MKILFTGASSFSGFWFVKELAQSGHSVSAIFQGSLENYQGLRKERMDQLLKICRPVFSCSFGSEAFLKVLGESKWDLLCHHAADVSDYKSPDFNFAAALTNNTNNLKSALNLLVKQGCNRILLTGSVFEQNEGAGSDNLRAVSPYGLSKGLTSDVFKFYTSVMEMKLGKFVIPNPFGPYEEARFTTFLIQTWYKGQTAPVAFPAYVRDNIPVSLLAKAYADFASRLSPNPGLEQINPSGYPESQGAFTRRFAEEMSPRLSVPCNFELYKQEDFSEPKVRINTDILDSSKLGWDEVKAWDDLAYFYETHYKQNI